MKLTINPKTVLNWFVHRAIETVDSWDGKASNYADTSAYCKACLIDVNTGSEKKQTHCMLPVKRPGSSKMADKAIFAVAGGRGLSAVKKPSDVDQAKWDAAVSKAAKTVVNAYKDMEKTPPSSMMEMAGMARAISVDLVFQQLQMALYDQVEMWGYGTVESPGYLVTVYIDNGELYALFNKEGLLRRSLLTLGDNDVVTMGELEDVTQQFTPTQRSQISIKRQADGNYRVFMLAATALINKAGQIDSTALFDDMIQRAEDYGFYPSIDFFHLGEEDESCDFGKIDFLGREGICYLASGVLYQDHELTQRMVPKLEKNPEEWGVSIEYYPLLDSIDFVQLDTIEIPVFLRGLNTRISILPATEACSWFTSVELEENTMTDAQKAALKKLLGDDEFERRMKKVDGVNGEVNERKLIFRAKAEGEGTVTEPVAEAGATADAGASDKTTTQNAEQPAETPNVVSAELAPEIELDEEAVAAIAEAVTENATFSTMFTALTDKLTQVLADLSTLQTNFAASQATVARMDTRLQGIEQEEQEHQQTVQADTPRRVNDAKMRMTYRPRHQRAVEVVEEVEEDYAQVADKTLERIPSYGAYN